MNASPEGLRKTWCCGGCAVGEQPHPERQPPSASPSQGDPPLPVCRPLAQSHAFVSIDLIQQSEHMWQVDRVEGGVRLGYVALNDGVVENLLHIDVTVSPGVGGGKPTFQAVRSGRYKTRVPPGEQTIMQSLLQALRKAVDLARS